MNTSQSVISKISVALLAISLLILIVPNVIRISYLFPITYNEGWNVYHSDRAIKGEKLYDKNHELTPLIYPPLFYYIEGVAGKIFGDALIVGRILALLSLFGCGIFCGLIAKQLEASWIGILFTSIFFVASVAAFAPQYVGMNDPQLFAHVFSLAALLFVPPASSRQSVPPASSRQSVPPASSRHLILIALLLTISIFIKHNLIAVPAVIGLELLLRSRKQFLIWLLAFIGFIIIFTLLTILFAGDAFLDQVLAGRYVSWTKMIDYGRSFATVMIVPLFFAVLWLPSSIRNEQRPVGLWLLFSILIGTIASAGFGTAINMYFDAFLCLSVLGGLLLTQKPRWIILGILFSVSILWTAGKQVVQVRDYRSKLQQRETSFVKDVEYVRNYKGRVACSSLLLCYSAGREFELDPFSVTQRIMAGKMPEGKIVQLFDSGYFDMVQVKEQRFHSEQKPTRTPEMFPDSFFTVNIISALRKNYSVARKTDVGAYYVFKKHSR